MGSTKPLKQVTPLAKYIIECQKKTSGFALSGASIEFIEFLRNTSIQPDLNCEAHIPRLRESESYPDFIDALVSYLVLVKSSNVLVHGYAHTSAGNQWNSHIVNSSVSFQVNQLKDNNWNTIYNIVGRTEFMNLILKYKCYVKQKNGSLVQIFGNQISNDSPSTSRKSISKMLYKSRRIRQVTSVLPQDSMTLLKIIFPGEVNNFVPKKYRKLRNILFRVIKNDKKTKYNYIYNNLVSRCSTSAQVLENVTPISEVIRFVITIIGKLFPLEVWGSTRNKSILFRNVVMILNSSLHQQYFVQESLKSVSITEIPWLGKTRRITSKQDHESRCIMLRFFVEWFYFHCVTDIIKLFWYVTESTSEESTLFYFPHYNWNVISGPWVSKYIETFLEEVRMGEELHVKGLDCKFNYGRMRLIPKKRDFRFICVPSRTPFGLSRNQDAKTVEKQKYEYIRYVNGILRPVRQILSRRSNEVRNRTIPRSRSFRDIATQISSFKFSLLDRFGQVPNLYFVKFDMKTCYDNLNQSRIVVSLESLFDGIDDDTEFFTRQYSENSTRNSKLKAMITEIRHGGNAHTYKLDESLISKNDARVLIDRTKTLKFSKKEILEISKTQIFDSIVSINGGKFYSRKTGIFQGLPLSGTFCDIVYDDMIQEQFQFLLCCEDSLIARLADDFLVITTRFNNYQKVLDVINGESLNEYGAVVNSEKTSIINDRNTTDSFRFVGLVIEIGTLEISREFTKNPFPSLSSQKSFKTAFEYLSSCYKQRLCDFMLDLELDTLKTILHNINNLLGSLMSTFRSEYKHLVKKDSSFSELEFEAFLIQLLQITLEKFFEINGEHVGFDDIIIDFKSTLQLEFQSIPQFMDVLKRIHSIDI